MPATDAPEMRDQVLLWMLHQPPPPPRSGRIFSSLRRSPQLPPRPETPSLARLLRLDDQRLAAHARLEHRHTRALGDARVHVRELVHTADGGVLLAALEAVWR